MAGCRAESSDCTLIGTPVGIGLEVSPPLAGRVHGATLEICQGEECVRPRMELFDDDRGGGKRGFGDVGQLRKAPTTVRVMLRDAKGGRLLDRTIEVTPAGRFPNGPRCGEGGPNATVVVEGEGGLHEKP